jgi:thymidylate kinase
MAKLIILRGPSGAGKSSVAKVLHEGSKQSTVLLEQDYYKEVMVKPKDLATIPLRREMLLQDTLLALQHDYHVILDGILDAGAYGEMFETLFREHPDGNYAFYFDVSLDETLNRHKSRPQVSKFGEAEMREWFPGSTTKLAKDFEHVIPESNTLEQTVDFIRKTTDLL